MFDEEVSGFDDIPSNMTFVTFMSVFMFAFIFFMIIVLNNSSLRSSQEDFQRGLSSAVKAYSTTYSTDPEALKYLSEGYLLNEDLNIYGVNTNPVQINRSVASQYLFKVLNGNVTQNEALLRSCGLYIIDVTTEYNRAGGYYNPRYKVSIYKNGDTALAIDVAVDSLDQVQTLVEDRIGNIKIDIARGFNSSLREAQKYKEDESKTGDNQTTYSTYSTTMAIVKDVPMASLFGFVKKDVKEIQTYSIKRGDS